MAPSARELPPAHPPGRHAVRSPTVLLELVANGDDEVFREFYASTAARVFAVALSVLRDVDHAEEVTQEVYLEIWRLAWRFDSSKGSAISWVTMLARSRAVDRVRQSEAARVRDTGYARSEPEFEPGCVLDEVVRQSEQRQLRFAVAGLSPLRREAILLTFFGGLSYSEASRHLGIPVSTMKTRIRDGLFALRGMAAGEESPGILRVNSSA